MKAVCIRGMQESSDQARVFECSYLIAPKVEKVPRIKRTVVSGSRRTFQEERVRGCIEFVNVYDDDLLRFWEKRMTRLHIADAETGEDITSNVWLNGYTHSGRNWSFNLEMG